MILGRPMSEHASLITSVQELGFCTAEDLDEVQAREVIYGGDLELNLLELHLLTEAQLLAGLSAWTGLPASEPGYLEIDDRLSRTLRAAGLEALSARRDPDTPIVFVPVVPSEEDQNAIQEVVGALVEVQICSKLRFNEALHFLESRPSGARVDRVLEELGARPILTPGTLDPETRPEPFDEHLLHAEAVSAVSPSQPPGSIAVEASSKPPAPTRSSTPAPISDPKIVEINDELHPASVRRSLLDDSPISAAETGPPPEDYEEVARSASLFAPAGLSSPSPRASYAPNEAAQDLLAAKTRDRVIDVLLHFAAQYFDYTALFAVLSDEARGLRAAGTGASTESVKALRIPLDLPSAFRDAQQSSAHRIARLRASGLEGGIARDLARPTGKRFFLLPLAVRNRTVLLLWGDKGQEDVELNKLGDLFAFAPKVSEALVRLVQERKRTSLIAAPPKKRPQSKAVVAKPDEDAPLPPDFSPKAGVNNQAEDMTRQAEHEPSPLRAAAPVPASGVPSASGAANVHERPTKLRGAQQEEERTTVLSLPVGKQRRQTQRNTAAPPAAQREMQASIGSVPTHQVTEAKKRSLSGDVEGESRPPSAFPPEIPRTLRGYPDAKSPSERLRDQEQATTNESPTNPATTNSDAQVQSRRMVAVRPTATKSRPPIRIESKVSDADAAIAAAAGEAPSPPGALLSKEGSTVTKQGTLMSRRPPLPEPDESGWEADVAPVIRRVEPKTVQHGETSTCQSLLQRYIEGEESVLGQLIDHGDTAVGALMACFPGPFTEPSSPQTPASECGPVLRALVSVGSRAAPFLTIRTADEDPKIRRWATFVLGEIPGRDSALSIAGRLLDSAPEVRRAALSSARRAQGDGVSRRTVRAHIEGLARDKHLSTESRCAAIEALADIREHEAIPTLLQFIEDENRSIARASRWALSVLTRQDFGKDAAAWKNFWQEHRNQDRFDWLVESLNHEKRDLRRAAAEELRSVVGTDLGYDPDATPEVRTSSQQEFRAWKKNSSPQ